MYEIPMAAFASSVNESGGFKVLDEVSDLSWHSCLNTLPIVRPGGWKDERRDNVYYEVCNEPGGGVPGHVSPAEVDAWQEEMAWGGGWGGGAAMKSTAL